MAKAAEQLNIWFAVGAVILVVLFLIFLLPANNSEENETIIETDELIVVEQNEITGERVDEDIVYSESAMCEDYIFEQGQSINIDSHNFKVIKIGEVSVRASINGKEVIISEGDSVYQDGLRVEFKEHDLIFFGEDDEENRVEFTIGCSTDEDPTDKHILETIRSRGTNICDALIKQCETQFDTE